MKCFQHLVVAGLTSAALLHTAHAQQVYRCGNSYSQIPCAGAVTVPAEDSRSAAQRAAAQENLKRDKTLAKELETSRRKDEAELLAREKVAKAAQAATAKADAAKAKAKAASKQEQSADSTKQGGSKKSGTAGKKGEPFTVTLGSGKEKKKKK